VRIVLAGGSGFLGRALADRFRRDGHTLVVLTRRPESGQSDHVAWTPDGTVGPWAAALAGADAIVNLAGEGIADKRWNDERKRALRDSRTLPTRSLVLAIQQMGTPPAVFVNGSAVGYYGPHGDDVVTESTPPGSDFLSTLCVAWEAEAEQASTLTRVALVRTGLVLHPDGGALGGMLPPFRLGVGGPLGTGAQFMPWIHRDDWVALVVWLIANATARGAFNGSAPLPVTNREFTRALGKALHRPAFMPVPPFALRILLGEFADSLLAGQRAIPSRAVEQGFTFRFADLDAALTHLLG
jgi:uncharacterized protein (TIGR01777 family)